MEEKTVVIEASNKAEYRKKLILLFLDEESGSSTHSTCYNYYVETLKSDNRIYLKRPTHLNKGVDFEVRVENVQFKYGVHGNIISTGNRPSHSDIFNDLLEKSKEDSIKYLRVKELIEKIYRCEKECDKDFESLSFKKGLDTEMIIKVLKWLFIEQDITYWNKSGREMLYNGLKSEMLL